MNYLAFTASYDNDFFFFFDKYASYDNDYKTINSPHMLNNPENEFDDEVDLQIAYNDLFVECDNVNKQNRRNLKRLKETELEK